jgi:hypothetical protein
MTSKAPPKSERDSKNRDEYKRFLETAHAVGASDDLKDFDRAFKRVVPKAALKEPT